ncbi:MAG: DUF6077 domain-containing protein [Candidatus Gastranaerophilales bacterium]|nr:DUF6077 domain-containing protein [Candidatus Gastranaerophilales bacterium]
MVYLLCLFMILVPFVLGRGALCLLYRKQPLQGIALADSVLTGYIMMIGLVEAAHLATLVRKGSFSGCIKLFAIALGVCLAAMLCVVIRYLRKQGKDKLFSKGPTSRRELLLWLIFAMLFVIQATLVATKQQVYLGGDMTVETVNSFLTDDAIYQVNPMTGASYSLGIPLRLKILCLPTFYGILCSLFGLEAWQVVWVVMPILTLVYSYLAYSLLAKIFFPASGEKRGCFLILVAILYLAGDYLYGMDGFGVMHGGFRGNTIRMAVLLPYTLGLVCRRRWRQAVLCILAEACIVWTLYGMGACLFVAAGMVAVHILTRRKNFLFE